MLSKFLNQNASTLQFAGYLLIALGAVVLFASLQSFDMLPNYLRLLVPLPLAVGLVLAQAPDYARLETLKPQRKGRLLGLLCVPPVLLLGFLIWLVFDPGARA